MEWEWILVAWGAIALFVLAVHHDMSDVPWWIRVLAGIISLCMMAAVTGKQIGLG